MTAKHLDESRKKTWKETTKTVKWFGRKFTLSYPKLTDVRLVQILVLSIVNILGQTVFHFRITPLQIFFLMFTCSYFDILLTYVTKNLIIFPTSGLITSLSLALLMEVYVGGVMKYILYIVAGILAIGSKYLITYKHKHIFNPSNFAITMLLLICGPIIQINPNEWPSSVWLLVPIILIGGRLIIKAKVVSVAISLFVTEAILYGVMAYIRANGPLPLLSEGMSLLSPAMYIFTFYMITDPRTVPRNGIAKICFGVAIAAFHWICEGLGFGVPSLFLGLFITCLFVPILDKLSTQSVGIFRYIH